MNSLQRNASYLMIGVASVLFSCKKGGSDVVNPTPPVNPPTQPTQPVEVTPAPIMRVINGLGYDENFKEVIATSQNKSNVDVIPAANTNNPQVNSIEIVNLDKATALNAKDGVDNVTGKTLGTTFNPDNQYTDPNKTNKLPTDPTTLAKMVEEKVFFKVMIGKQAYYLFLTNAKLSTAGGVTMKTADDAKKYFNKSNLDNLSAFKMADY